MVFSLVTAAPPAACAPGTDPASRSRHRRRDSADKSCRPVVRAGRHRASPQTSTALSPAEGLRATLAHLWTAPCRHCLLEGAPGLAKTLAAKSVARIVGGSFARLQFTPDLMPSDLVATRIYRPSSERFDIELGPVFANVVLADEINRR